jgi:tripartite-type tricarboxylate transporter receptor subunit TctC
MTMAVLLASISSAQAQDYPVRPVRMVYVYTGGGVSDLLARVAAQKLGENLGQPVIVESKPGAGGLIGTRDALRAQPLGYSILFSTTSLIGNLHAYRDPQYKLEDFTPIGVIGEIPFTMIIHDSVPAKNLAQFIAYAKANPGKLNYGSIGPSAGGTILSERLKAAAGIDMVQIPFKGGEPASVALYAGNIHVYFATLGVARLRMKHPRIVGLAVTSAKRTQAFPDIPSFRELGFPGMDMGTWHALFVPSAAPRPIIQRLQAGMRVVTSSPELKAQLEKNSEEPWLGTLDEFVAKMKEESANMAGDYKRLNLPVHD